MRLVSFCLAIEHAYAFFDAKKRFLENSFWSTTTRNTKEDYNVLHGVVGAGIYADLDC